MVKHLYLVFCFGILILIYALKTRQVLEPRESNKSAYTYAMAFLQPIELIELGTNTNRGLILDVFKTTGVVSTGPHHRNDECAIWYPP